MLFNEGIRQNIICQTLCQIHYAEKFILHRTVFHLNAKNYLKDASNNSQSHINASSSLVTSVR